MEKQRTPRSISYELLCKGKRFAFALSKIDFADRVIIRDLLIHPGAVVIIPLISDQEIIMLKQYRPGPQGWILELPAGTLEAGEDPRDAAARELLEETGYRAREIRFLFKMYSSPGISTEVLHVFLARDLVYVGEDHQEDEMIEIVRMSIDDALEMIRKGVVVDAKTIASLLYYISLAKESA
ncbi:MAG TPA: NUDIX hydrolase [Sulfolobales archaeon]|nr:NUDIX hydrolase [Sulfolobales archaeon]